MGESCCNGSQSPLAVENSRKAPDDSGDAHLACNHSCCDVQAANPKAKFVDTCSDGDVNVKPGCLNAGGKPPAARPKNSCCGDDPEADAEAPASRANEGSCADQQSSADDKSDEKLSCCDSTEQCSDECAIFAASAGDKGSSEDSTFRPASRQSDQSDFQRTLARYRALLNTAKCICRSVLDEKGVMCCAQKKKGMQLVNSKPGCYSSKTNVEPGCTSFVVEAESACGSSKAKTGGKSREFNMDGCCTTLEAPKDAGGIRGTDEKIQSGCCSKKTTSFSCGSAPGPQDIKKGGCCSSTAVEIVPKAENLCRVKRATRDADPEKDSGFEHVALSVEGMTCNDCADKLSRTLKAIGTHNVHVNFVRGQADFDIEPSLVSVDSVLVKARTATGFILNRIKQGSDESLHLLVSEPAARSLAELDIDGLKDVTVINKTIVRVDYDPIIIGARDLLEKIGDLSKGLASPGADPAVSAASIIFTIPVVALAWGEDLVTEYTRGIVSFPLGTLVQFLAVPVFYKPALRALLVYHSLELDMLVVVSITAAYLYSIVAFSFRLAGKPLETAEFFETSTLLITLVMLGRLLASYARIRAVAAVSMRSLQSTTAILPREDGQGEQVIDSRLLQYGDLFKVLPHCRIPTDGVIVDGVSDVDESMLTGESIPVVKEAGSSVLAGTINCTGTLLVRLTELPGKNTVMDIARMVDEASNSKPRVQDLADRVASYFLPVISATALMVLIIWIIVGFKVRNHAGGDAVAVSVTYAIALLAICCPCALGLAVPMVLVIAGGIAARGGVILKSAECTERSRKVTDVVFDKTGTLTDSDLDVLDEDFFGHDRDETAGIVKAMVSESRHPVSVAVAKHLSRATQPASVSDLQSIPGCGVEARRGGAFFRAGNPQWIGHQEHPKVQQFLEDGLTVLLATQDSTPIALFGLRTHVRAEAAKTVTELKRRGITVHLVSGDQRRAVESLAQTVGIDSANAVAQYTPDQKQKYVATLMDEKKYVLFCGDGTNDAVAVAQANIGAQISDSITSSDVTGGAADVILRSGLSGIPFLLDVSKASYRRIVFNFAWSAFYNVLAIMLAGGAFVKIRIPPAYAGAGELISVLPVIAAAMSMMLLKLKP